MKITKTELEMHTIEQDTDELWGEMVIPKVGSALLLTPQEREVLGWMPKPLTLEGPRIHQPVGGEKFGGPTFAEPKGKALSPKHGRTRKICLRTRKIRIITFGKRLRTFKYG